MSLQIRRSAPMLIENSLVCSESYQIQSFDNYPGKSLIPYNFCHGTYLSTIFPRCYHNLIPSQNPPLVPRKHRLYSPTPNSHVEDFPAILCRTLC